MFNFAKLRYLILAGYLLPVLLSVVSALIVAAKVETVKETTNKLNRSREITDKIGTLAFNIQNIPRAARGYLLEKNEISLNSYKEGLKEFQISYPELQQLIEDDEQQKNLAVLIERVNQLSEFDGELIDLVDRDRVEEAIEKWKGGTGQKLSEQIADQIEEIRNREKSIVDEKIGEKDRALMNLSIIVWNSTGLSLLAALGIGLFIISIIVGRIDGQARAIAHAASEIATTIEEQERVAMQQASSVNQTTTSMDELGSSSRQSAEQALAVSEGANQVLILVSGQDIKRQLLSNEDLSLKMQMKEVQGQIQRLSDHLGQIYNITNTVSDLASQTNMLALNASVEAVRAGEHGRGFGVVASEIRKLADRSRQSAERISGLVMDIQNATNSTVVVTQEGSRGVENIVVAINDMAVNLQQISLNTKQQAIAIQQVVDAMNSLNIATQESASGIAQTKVSTQQLNQAASNLQSMV